MNFALRSVVSKTLRAPVVQGKRFYTPPVMNHPFPVNGYRDKTMMEAWAGDSGAYPVMGVIAFAVVFSLGYGTQYLFRNPDARIAKNKRTGIFRGELLNADGSHDATK